jgi:hypothetical protein
MSSSKDAALVSFRDTMINAMPASVTTEADITSQVYGSFLIRGAVVFVGRAKGGAMTPRTPRPGDKLLGADTCRVESRIMVCERDTAKLGVIVVGIGPAGQTPPPAEEVAAWVDEVWPTQQ